MQDRRSIRPFLAKVCTRPEPGLLVQQSEEAEARIRACQRPAGVLHLRLAQPHSRERPSASLERPLESFDPWLEDGPDAWRAPGSDSHVCLQADRFEVKLADCVGALKGSWALRPDACGLHLERLPGQQVFGLGLRADAFEHGGRRATLWNVDAYEYTPESDNLYQSCPFFLVVRDGSAFGVFVDSPARTTFDFGADDPELVKVWTAADRLEVYLLPGPHPANVIERFTELTGRAPLPPLWSLGYHQSRYSYASEQEVRAVTRELRKRRMPCDAIHIDIDALEGYRSFHLCPDRFPDPTGLCTTLREDGFHTVVIVDPGIRAVADEPIFEEGLAGDHFCRTEEGEIYEGEVWPGACAFPDFSRAETRRWFGSLYARLVETGIAGFWNDMNEPAVFDQPSRTFPENVVHRGWGETPCAHAEIHNAYGHLMAQATYEGVARYRPERRVFVLSRAAFAGTQRYAATWTGDSSSNWEHFRATLLQVLSLGLSGQPFSGSDIGGFSKKPTAELFARWLELGALLPLCRTHTEKLTPRQEPWSFGEPFSSFNRRAIQRRYRLLPYLYLCFYDAHQRGLPVARPLLLEFPDDAEAVPIDDQLMIGGDVLVAPVLDPDIEARDAYFPAGTWVHLERDEIVEGPSWQTIDAPLGEPAVFVRAGSILPLAVGEPQHTGEIEWGRPQLLAVGHNSATGRVYEDDGVSFAYREGAYRLLDVETSLDGPNSRLRACKRGGDWRLPELALEVEIRQVTSSGLECHSGRWQPTRESTEIVRSHSE